MSDAAPAAETVPPESKTATDLEWALLLERISRHCLGPVAVTRSRSLRPERTLEQARARMQLAAEILDLGERGDGLPVRAIEDLSPLFERIRRGGAADGVQLVELRQLLEVTHELRGFVTARQQTHAALAAALESDARLDLLLDDLRICLGDDGSVSDDASSVLRKARRRVEQIRRDLVARLKRLMSSYQSVLRDQYYAERDGRYVLPVRADAHLRVPGIVLGASGSGSTLYVEPEEITPVGNELRIALAEVAREEARVLADLSDQASELLDALEHAYEAGVQADVLAAIGRWAAQARARAILPEAEPVLELSAMRHPLLIGPEATVVANDLILRAGTGLVISGPNAGGKTVVLKCLGLAAWMARSGIPLPVAADSRVGFFQPVLTEVGDDQSLMMSLSTFSAHVAHLARFLDQVTPSALVLLDEVTAGTDPEEGAALAVALLEALVDRGAAVAATTHYERLKELAPHDERFENASVGLDLETMTPSFRLTLGVPGPSSALGVAERYGIPKEVVERARSLVPEGVLRLQKLVTELQAEREALAEARAEAEESARRQAELLAEIEAERDKIGERERARLAQQGRELEAAVRQARDQLATAKQQLRAQTEQKQLREAERLIDQAAHQVAVGSPLAQLSTEGRRPGNTRAARDEDLVAGTRVYVPKLGAHAEVVEPPSRGQVRVVAGAMKITVAVGEVELGPPGAKRKPQRSKRKARPATRGDLDMQDGFVPVRVESNTLDLRGERVDEGLERVEVFLDRLLGQNERAGFVLHGHGTGRLKAAVRAHLQASPYVDRSYPAEAEDGGDAFTVVWIRG